ncbi:peroxisomal membrane MPV17/PMP22-like protein isoform 1 [Galdieria sulphuraria]|uniref:Cytochrome c-553 n=1 Tax=Galdieria sulphuraria TaxID=130081 RepID=M2XWU7_GALSU|nr:peroxisomal membrane MPV17/PMP22-like protein isoform 1 [Galdieria sulphuraria]EME28103.1 peroxisomal membrane MPV17/PMP22-like protein isoform 1 [Galdieria sulphuraria]|eukprot:XP_005704623.1 peroxisomal membrane MPV17/PMP22-like protein isoform 1 [Galdieria sulphuraria]
MVILYCTFLFKTEKVTLFIQTGCKRLSITYLHLLKTKPVLTKAITSLFLFSTSDLFAQCITERKLNGKRIFRFALWGACVGAPLLHFWHSFIELFQPSSSHWRALCSVVIDQGFMTPVYTILFFIYDAVASGNPLRVGIQRAKTCSSSIIWKTWVFWYPAQFLNLRFIPVDLRVAYINAVNIGWNMYFSYITKSPNHTKECGTSICQRMMMMSQQRGECSLCFVVIVHKRWIAKKTCLYSWKYKRSLVNTSSLRDCCFSVITCSSLSIQEPLSITAFNQANTLFEQNCAACHNNGGNIIFYARNKTLFPKALEKNGYLNKESISDLTKQGKGAMPGYANKLNDEEISLLSDYILQRAAENWK